MRSGTSMMRKLIVERFKLKFHQEKRELSVYVFFSREGWAEESYEEFEYEFSAGVRVWT